MNAFQIVPGSRVRRTIVWALAFLAMASVTADDTPADIVELHDGRRFEGRIIGEYPEGVVIDSVTSGVRATLAFWASQVKQVRRAELPDDFFDTVGNVANQRMSGEQSKVKGPGYMVIPIEGRIGYDVTAQGLESALQHAVQKGARDIVFTVNVVGGTDWEAIEILEVLTRYEGDLYYRAVVRRAEDVGLVVPLVARETYLAPNAVLAGIAPQSNDARPVRQNVADERRGRAQAPTLVRDVALQRGVPNALAAALADPGKAVVVWRSDNDMLAAAEQLPDDVPKGRVVFRHHAGATIRLDRGQAADLRLGEVIEYNPADEHPVKAVARAEGIARWHSVSEYGRVAMRRGAQLERARRYRARSAFLQAQPGQLPGFGLADIAQTSGAASNLSAQVRAAYDRQRDMLADRMVQAWRYFLAVDPYAGQYTTYGVNVGRGSVIGGAWTEVYLSVLTPRSRRQWRQRSLQAIAALKALREAYEEYVQVNVIDGPGSDAAQSDAHLLDIDGRKVAPRDLYREAGRLIERLWRERNRREP